LPHRNMLLDDNQVFFGRALPLFCTTCDHQMECSLNESLHMSESLFEFSLDLMSFHAL
jgi:hypothetical protein